MAHQKQIAIADDGLQQIVEIMRDAARQLADRLHLLRLRELGFQRLLLGGVDQVENGARFSIRARHERAREKLRAPIRLLAAEARSELPRDRGKVRRRRACDEIERGFALIRGHQLAEICAGRMCALREEFGEHVVGFGDAAVRRR